MILKRYILIFTLALISCVVTKYIQMLTSEDSLESEGQKLGKDLIDVNNEEIKFI